MLLPSNMLVRINVSSQLKTQTFQERTLRFKYLLWVFRKPCTSLAWRTTHDLLMHQTLREVLLAVTFQHETTDDAAKAIARLYSAKDKDGDRTWQPKSKIQNSLYESKDLYLYLTQYPIWIRLKYGVPKTWLPSGNQSANPAAILRYMRRLRKRKVGKVQMWSTKEIETWRRHTF